MPNVRQIKGNYTELTAKIFAEYPIVYSSDMVNIFTSDSKDITNDLLKDLNRQSYFPSNGLTYEEHVAHWMAPSTSKAYSQGNINASFFTLSIKDFILWSPKFIQNPGWFSSLLNKLRGIPTRDEDHRMYYFKTDNKDDFSVAYFDDQGIPCGMSIAYSKLDPTIWTATIIRNTTAAPEDREVLMLSPEDTISHLGEEGLTSATQATKTFFNFLNSESLAKVIGKNMFSANGKINVAQVEQLGKQYDEEHQVDPLGTVKRLSAQEHIIKGWKLTPEQVAVVNNALIVKQQDNISQRKDWLKIWAQEQRASIKKIPSLDTASKQSFFRRNIHNIFVGVATTVTLIGFALTLSGVLAPLGLALIGSTAMIMGAVGAGIALLTLLGSFIKLGVNEKNLATYKAELSEKQNASETLIKNVTCRVLQETSAEINLQNEQEQITRAILNANFSTEEFDMLIRDVEQAKRSATNELIADEISELEQLLAQKENDNVEQAKPSATNELIADEISELEQLFAQKENDLEEVIDDALGREAARDIQHLQHAQEILAEQITNTIQVNLEIPVNTNEHAESNKPAVGVY